MPYRIVTKDGKKIVAKSYKDLNKKLSEYLESVAPIDRKKMDKLKENIVAGLRIDEGIEFDNTVLARVYKGRQLIDVVTEKEWYIDELIRGKDNFLGKLPGHLDTLSDLIFNCILTGVDQVPGFKLMDVRKSLISTIAGMVSMSMDELITVAKMNVEEKKKKNDVDRLYG